MLTHRQHTSNQPHKIYASCPYAASPSPLGWLKKIKMRVHNKDIAAHSRFPTHETNTQNGYESAIFGVLRYSNYLKKELYSAINENR